MKVFFILPDLSAGGAERVTITIARIIQKEGFDVEFINLGKPSGEMRTWIEPEFKMINFSSCRVLNALPRLVSFMRNHHGAVFFSSREHVSVISLLAAKITNRSIVVRIPNMPKNNLVSGLAGFKMRAIRIINHILLKYAKVIIAQNIEMKRQLCEYYRLPSNKIVAINNPIDIDFVRSSALDATNPFREGEVNFLNVCNIAFSKGIDILEAAWPKVKECIPNAHMYIVGRNTSEYAHDLMRKAEILKDFTFMGFNSNPYPLLKYCDIFVLPSRMEGFPNVVLEAQCFNRPIVSTTCVEVIKEIIVEGVNGYYCEVENPVALADCMIKAIGLKNIENEYKMFDKDLLLGCFQN